MLGREQPIYLAAALNLTRSGAVIVIDNVVRKGAVVLRGTGDARVEGVRHVVDNMSVHPDLDATAFQTVGIRGWDGLILARCR
jgi:predicted O-methyltransferase YrrM